MNLGKYGLLGAAGLLLVSYNFAQSGVIALRDNEAKYPGTKKREGYGPSLEWVDRLARASTADTSGTSVDAQGNLKIGESRNVKLDFSVLSSLMVAGLASGFKSQVANLLWMKSDEYWHQGLFTRQVPLMEAVVTLDPQFIDAWSTAGWHWAYNIYADIPMNPDYKTRGEAAIAKAQENAVETGLDYLKRGANMNPDKYRLWFEWGWTRAEKAGIYDTEGPESTLALYKEARSKDDAREIEVTGPDGKMKKEQGMDLMGRTIGHLLERIPEFDKALDVYAELMNATPQDRRDLAKVGDFWHRYGTDYHVIGSVYQNGDPVTRAQIKKLVPDVEELIRVHAARERLANGNKGQNSQPVGAYVTISARYMPAWNLKQQGKFQEAINEIVGVMQGSESTHLQGLPVMEKVFALRGDSPQAIKTNIQNIQQVERVSSQDLGLHFLAKLYEMAAKQAESRGNAGGAMKLYRLAYETWYRSRARDALDFYALRNTRLYENNTAKFGPARGFKTPQKIVDAIKESRKGGVPNAAPALPPNVAGYY